VTKSELIEKIAEKMTNLTVKDVERIVNVFFAKLTAALAAGDRIEIRGFGTFSVRTRKPRVAINPRNNERIEVPSKNTIHFKTGKELHARLNAEN